MARPYSGNDRRRFQRLKVNLTVIYKVDQPLTVRMKIGDKEIEATTLDLSEGGVAFVTNYNIPERTVLFIKFTLFKIEKTGEVNFFGPMEIIGEVRSNAPMEKGEHRLGVCFTRIEQKDKEQISDFVKRVIKGQ